MDISILLCIDGNYWQHVGVTIASLLRSNPGNTFRIFVASATRIDQRRLGELRSIVPAGRGTLEAIVYKEAANYQHLPIHDHLTFAAYLRLFMAEYLDQAMQRIIYLDSDLVVCGDLGELWQIDLEGAYVGAAPEPYDERQRTPFGFGPKDLYINSGVLVIDLAKWRADNILARFVEFANANQELLIYSLDQDILNSVCRGRICNIGYEWNWQALFPRFTPEELGLTAAKFAELRRAPRIVHYTGPYKPWYYRWEPHYKRLYYESLAQTPWASYVPPDKTLRNLPVKLSKTFQKQLEWHFPSLARQLRRLRK
jgi:lipopolysaccharide biosynthesis glycosyltransferase